MNAPDPPLREPALQSLRDSHLRLLSIHRSFQELYSSLLPPDPARDQRYIEKLPALLDLAQKRVGESEDHGEQYDSSSRQDEPIPAQRSLRKRPAPQPSNTSTRNSKSTRLSPAAPPKRGKSSTYYITPPERTGKHQHKLEFSLWNRRWKCYVPWRGKLGSDRLAMVVTLARVNGRWRGVVGGRGGGFLRRNLEGR